MLKKYTLVLVLVSSLIMPQSIWAAMDSGTVSELQAQVKTLQIQLNSLVQRLSGLQATAPVVITPIPQETMSVCGDVNLDGRVSLEDATAINSYIFSNGTLAAGTAISDADGSGLVDISDAVYIIQYLNNNGPAPKCSAATQVAYFSCADTNSDGVLNLSDAIRIQDYIFSGVGLPAGRGDAEGSGSIDISAAV